MTISCYFGSPGWRVPCSTKVFFSMMQDYLNITDKESTVVPVPSLEFGALFDNHGGKVKVEKKWECRVTYPQRLDG